ncbi:ATP-binding protein [uncultured Clostridium sp.]|uniref:sensor histidine kinase n=1 Tax=uncultured Clostridium sp. TaxID=59620 RepID=UPI0025F841C7|nr:ATP-binding protein [uncultured Clostridium sp.]
MKFKFKRLRVVILCIMLLFNCSAISAYSSNVERKTILAIGSYSYQNEWESSILKGFRNILGKNNSIRTEYLDSYSKNTFTYHESFLNYLDAKYENQNIDYIFAMDDESLDIVKTHLFDEQRVIYKKPVFFVGINSIIDMTEEEKKYLSGVINIETCIECIDEIEKIHKNIKKIYVFCDDSIYSKNIIANISATYPENNGDIEIKIFKSNTINRMEDILKSEDFSDSAILLCSTYIDEKIKSVVSSANVIEIIQSITDVPIYSTLYNYVEAGAIGGVVNDGEKLGQIGASLLNSVENGDSESQAYIITPSFNSTNTLLFNFKAIRRYNINPLNLPEDSKFINKKPYNLALPKWIIYTFWLTAISLISLLTYLIYMNFYNRKKVELANSEAIAAIERDKIKTDYIILMSHEFRTPINIILNSAKLLKMKCDNDDYDKDYYKTRLNYIIKNCNRLSKTVNNSIDVAKLESGIMSTNFRMYNIIRVVEDITETIIDFAAVNNIEVVFDTEEEVVYTAIDKTAIERIILNLLSNAIKSMIDGGTLYVQCRNDSNNVYIYIKDTGIGMSEEVQRHIFDKFFQSSEDTLNRRHEGNGLGLFIVKGLVNLHNGTISVESEKGKGSIFEVIIPITVVDEEGEDSSINEELRYMAKVELSDIE